MHLISALAAGIRGAENGSAILRKRGTSTPATWYDDFEGSSANASGAPITLDANGAAVVYVNEIVDVTADDKNGVEMRFFTAGDASGAVEYQGQGFTGTDYATAQRAAGKPTQLQAVLDLWKTNAGAIDWQVLVNGVATKLSVFAGAVGGQVFNVKDPTYGAVGDGVTDDTAPIAAALSAANVNGGLVYFPPGNYRVTSALTLGAKTSLAGAGPTASAIGIDHATAGLFSVTGSVSYLQSISDLRLCALQSNSTGTLLAIGAASNLRVRDCTIGDSNSNGDVITAASSSATQFLFEGCDITVGGTTKALFNGAGALGRGRFLACTFNSPTGTYNATNGMVFGRQIDLTNCRFVNNATGGTYSCFKTNSTTVDARIHGCDFGAVSGPTVTAIELGTYTATAVFSESSNTFDSTLTAYSYVSANANQGADIRLGTRLLRSLAVTSSSTTTLTIPTDQYGTILLKLTGASAPGIIATKVPGGATGVVTVYNGSGGSLTGVGFGCNGNLAPPSVSLTNGQMAGVTYVNDGPQTGAPRHVVTGTPLVN